MVVLTKSFPPIATWEHKLLGSHAQSTVECQRLRGCWGLLNVMSTHSTTTAVPMEIETSTGDMFEVILKVTKREATLCHLQWWSGLPFEAVGREKSRLQSFLRQSWKGLRTNSTNLYSTCGTVGSGLQCYHKVLYGCHTCWKSNRISGKGPSKRLAQDWIAPGGSVTTKR